MPELWAGTDAGKAAHHCTVIDTDGTKVLSRRVPNNEAELLELIADVLALAEDDPVTWAIDLNAGGAALLIALLTSHGQRLLYIPGRAVHHASRSYRGDGKTDAKDAYVIADQARMRRDLQPLQNWDEIAVDLKVLTARRYDLAADRTRAINRLRAQLLEYFPALERAFDYAASKGALVLLTGYQTPAALRRIGASRLATWLKNRKVRGTQALAEVAVAAVQAQHTAVAGEATAAAVVCTLAKAVLALDEEITVDLKIAARFREHRDAEVITSMPGMGPLLGAEFIACTGGDMDAFGSTGRLAGVAGLAPVPRDSGRISGNMRRPHRYHRRLLRVFYLSAQIAARFCPTSKTFYDRKRAEGKSHKQAILALARRRLDVLWALIRDQRHYTVQPPQPEPLAA
ncbi:IS110 family transposase [Streptomyces sp. KS 21]|uniref:IS110 family transposase n=1 Tax=Streptomyces sp. KS 21 TaxID=2485150 RepID=UPI00106459EA|nr:IS110 family transposase [Streptomyces sp. KS 21]TDU73601.1 transposase IS116/IS110/IS902 family protein [Streptomyces sp. KS 21]